VIPLVPDEKLILTIKELSTAAVVSDKQQYKGSVEITNTGNVTAYDVPVTIKSNGFSISPKNMVLSELPPMGSKKIEFKYSLAAGFTQNEGTISVNAHDQTSRSRTIRIAPFIQTVTVAVSAAVAAILICLFLFFRLHRKK
jgi:uncharacterized membrane protein